MSVPLALVLVALLAATAAPVALLVTVICLATVAARPLGVRLLQWGAVGAGVACTVLLAVTDLAALPIPASAGFLALPAGYSAGTVACATRVWRRRRSRRINAPRRPATDDAADEQERILRQGAPPRFGRDAHDR